MDAKLLRFPPELYSVSGIYIHIPFCRAACHYCDFHFSTQLKRIPEMIRAIDQELAIRMAISPQPIDTLYFGGGTPSLIDPHWIDLLIQRAKKLNPSRSWAESTLEANPEDISAERCEAWLDAGINRLSIGVQTFDDRLLGWMNRKHTGEQAQRAIETAAKAGFKHLTADLIYGLPGRTTEDWTNDLHRMLSLPVGHLSAYMLTVEPKTVLGRQVAQGLAPDVDETQVSKAYERLCVLTANAGFEHYEVSNFAKPGAQAIHNSQYWSGAAYIGVGPGAHGFDGLKYRWANWANNPRYLQSMQQAKNPVDLPCESEELSSRDRYNETLMTGFRTTKGIDLEQLENTFGIRPDKSEPEAWARALTQGMLQMTAPNKAQIPESQWLVGDTIAARFFEVD